MKLAARFGGVLTLALLALAVAAPAPVAAQDGGYTKEQLQEIYMQFLKEEGYVPHVDEDGDVVFKAEGRTYFIGVNEKDPEFFRLVFPFFWEIESEAERTKAFSACNHANLETKVAKVFVVKDNTWASVELFVQSPEDFKPLFKRSLSAIKVSVDSFAEKMRE